MPRFLLDYDGNLLPLAEKPAKAAPSATKVGAATATTVDPKGLVVARIAQLDVIDHDGDVTVSDAVGSGQDILIGQWGHGSWQPGLLPVGRGRVTEEDRWLILRGRFFMSTTAGRETFETLRGLEALSPWSYGFDIAVADFGTFKGQRVRFLRKLVIHEASPVLRAAGIGTATVELSSLDPLQLRVAAAARENDRRLLEMAGYKAGTRRIVGLAPDGKPIRIRVK